MNVTLISQRIWKLYCSVVLVSVLSLSILGCNRSIFPTGVSNIDQLKLEQQNGPLPHWKIEFQKMTSLTPIQREKIHQIYKLFSPGVLSKVQQRNELFQQALEDYPGLANDPSFNPKAAPTGTMVRNWHSGRLSVEQYHKALQEMNSSIKQACRNIWIQLQALLQPDQLVELSKIMKSSSAG